MDQVEDLRAQGNALFNRKLYGDAITAYTKALDALEAQCNTDDTTIRVKLLNNRSVAFYRHGDYKHSLEDAQNALKHDKLSSKALYRAGLACLMLNQPAEACRHLQTLCSPDFTTAAPENAAELLLQAKALLSHQELIAGINKESNQAKAGAETQAATSSTALVEQALKELSEDIEGDSDADVPSCLATLQTTLSESAECRALFEASNGYRLLWYFFTEPFCSKVAGVFKSAATSAVLWPPTTWQKLLQFSLGNEGHLLAAEAVELVRWAAEKSPVWVMQHVLTHPLPLLLDNNSTNKNPSPNPNQVVPLQALVDVLHHCTGKISERGIGCDVFLKISNLLDLYSSFSGRASALRALACRPLHALLTAFASAEDLVASERENLSAKASQTLKSSQASKDTASSSSSSPSSILSKGEADALEELLTKQRAVYDVRLVSLRRALLCTLRMLCSSRDLIMDEALVLRSLSDDGKTKTKTEGGPLVPTLLSMLRSLVEKSPKRTTPVLGPDGYTAAYTKKPFAADFVDNPAGDFLASLDLSGGGGGGGGGVAQATPAAAGAAAVAGNAGVGSQGLETLGSSSNNTEGTLLEIALDIALTICSCSTSTATLAFRNGVLTLCQKLCEFSTPAVVIFGQKLCAAVCGGCPAAWDEILQEGSVVALAGLGKYSNFEQVKDGQVKDGQSKDGQSKGRSRVAVVLDKLASQVDACSGDDFAALTGTDAGMVVAAVQLAVQTSPPEQAELQAYAKEKVERKPCGKEPALRLLRMCAERSVRIQNKPKGALPTGGGWAFVDCKQLETILRPAVPPSTAQSVSDSTADEGLQKLKKGFFGAPSSSAAASVASVASKAAVLKEAKHGSASQSEKMSKSNVVYSSGSVVIEDVTEEEETKNKAAKESTKTKPLSKSESTLGSSFQEHNIINTSATKATTINEKDNDNDQDSDGDIPELRDVYDSTPTDAGIRSARAAWLSIPPLNRVRWSQTSTDVSAWFKVPLGTRAREISVHVAPGKLSVGVGWFGKIAEGDFHAGVKARESTWCLEDDEVHVVLPKDGTGQWWKTLFSGGEEKGYYELLQDAVDADEPAQQYDDMDPDAKDLLDSILERQAYVNAGLIDLENGFDDFRIVLGESSLGMPQQGNSSGSSGGASGSE